MTQWQPLVNTLLLGTQNAPDAVEAAAGESPEQALLRQVALASVYRHAGYVPRTVKPPQINAAPPETQPACSAEALRWMHRLNEHYTSRQLMPDWFLLIANRGKRLPHSELPYLLNMAAQTPNWMAYLWPILGERGRWMITHTWGEKQTRTRGLWEAAAAEIDLKPAEIEEKRTELLELRKEMMEGLANE